MAEEGRAPDPAWDAAYERGRAAFVAGQPRYDAPPELVQTFALDGWRAGYDYEQANG